ncbi:MAG: hypothetical protein ACOYMN_01765 [Roseimicrobium sp.]
MNAETGNFSLGLKLSPFHDPIAQQDALAEVKDTTYDVSLIDQVWQMAQIVPGNDPSVWRKDGSGAWIHRMAYRNRRTEFGWEIADCGFTLRSCGIAALRAMQWQNHLDFLVSARSSVVTAEGQRNARRLL